jgi:hypothetical protein
VPPSAFSLLSKAPYPTPHASSGRDIRQFLASCSVFGRVVPALKSLVLSLAPLSCLCPSGGPQLAGEDIRLQPVAVCGAKQSCVHSGAHKPTVGVRLPALPTALDGCHLTAWGSGGLGHNKDLPARHAAAGCIMPQSICCASWQVAGARGHERHARPPGRRHLCLWHRHVGGEQCCLSLHPASK